MFKLYRYENMLYTMALSGSEIDGFLEHSCRGWFSTVDATNDYILNYRKGEDGQPLLQGGRLRLGEPVYNFDSAAGIDYTVDITRPAGDRVQIVSFSDGRPFYADSTYRVAINSYRGSGGGGHIRYGAGLTAEEALERLINSTERDLRYYMIEWIEKNRELEPLELNNWRLIPERIVVPAVKREYKLVYGE
jgi:2',3'-cyclic-nucleotide 2'-phosphodiesterase/3'-nucleotidase